MSKKTKCGMLLFLLILTIFTYMQVLNNGYVWDDNIFFQERENIKNAVLSWKTISHTVLPNASYFRPLVFLTYILEIKIFGLNPVYMHLDNLIIHLINILLAYRLSEILTQDNDKNLVAIPFITASVFALHPIQIETITWIAGRFDLLATTFSFLTLITLLGENKNKIILGGISFFMALLSKESAVLLIPIYLTAISFNKKNISIKEIFENIKNHSKEIAFLLTIFFVYFLIRSLSLDHTIIQSDEFKYINNGFFNKIWYGFYITTEYIFILLNPFSNIGPVHPQMKDLTHSLTWYLYPIISLTLTFYYLYNLIKNNDSTSKLFILFIISISLFTQIFVTLFLAQNTIADRYMYFPLFFFISFILIKFFKLLKPSLILLIISIYISISIFTIKTTLPMWKDDLTLWFWQYNKYPNSFAKELYFHELIRLNRLDILDKEFKNIKNEPTENLNNNGDIDLMINQLYAEYLIRKNDPNSVIFLEKLINIFPSNISKENNVKKITLKRAYISCLIQLSQAFYYINHDYKNASKALNLAKEYGHDQYDVIEWSQVLDKKR
ncbi:hypothetical protein [Acinetobacter sp. MD2]|uniref:hypothetical protein n=1 Tax=Acinetobacter sp. MD2 TaxID=2600066 RepID=UPI002D1E7299|nr:hypothetical protein [Acinetobacter sp. MD2]MEB3767270.1 hypothetical protein [Acinetobacter sp. MD2]